MKPPVCTIIAGPNGAGKTTFALEYLPHVAHCKNFVNADMIAAGLSPLNPEREWQTAGRIYLREIRDYVARREDFAFETTLAGKTHLHLIRSLVADGWEVTLIYLWLQSVEDSIDRVAERVSHGGHDVPLDTLKRRYPRSVRNLLYAYAPICKEVICVDNTRKPTRDIFTISSGNYDIISPDLFTKLEQAAIQ